MGSRRGVIRVFTRLTEHNSEQDRLDELAHEALAAEIRELVEKPRYAEIVVFVDSES